MTDMIIGVDIGGTNVKGVLMNLNGKISFEMTMETGAGKNNIDEWLSRVITFINDLKRRSGSKQNPVGIAAPGLTDEGNTIIKHLPERLTGIENFEWRKALEQANVYVLNDALAALNAEYHFGAGVGYNNIVLISLGTGVGGALLINGELFSGNQQMAGHVGHTVINSNDYMPGIIGLPGTLEMAIGDETVKRRTLGVFTSTRDLVQAYKRGDVLASFFWLDTIRKLAMGISSISNILSPEAIIISGGITKANEMLFNPLRAFLDLYEWKNTGRKIDICKAKFESFAGAIGAGKFAISMLNNNK